MFSRIQPAALLAALTTLTVLGAQGSAHAGQYHVYSCRTPAGGAAPADGWSGSKVGTYTYAENTCAQPDGGLLAGLGDQAARTANTDSATWAFTAPPGSRIANAVLWRAGDADGGGAVNATFQFWLAGPTESGVFDECLYVLGCTTGRGDPNVPLAPGNRVEVPVANRGSRLFAVASCGGISEYKCKEKQGDPNNYAAVVYVYAADITLEQSAGPSAGAPAGELATAASVAGTSDVTFQASDPGAGVYAALVSVDGVLVQTTALDENGGRCRNVGGTTDGLGAFLYTQPCVQSLTADVGVDTTRLANGAHHLVVSVIDAAGNSATVLDRNVTVANPSGQAGGGGATQGGGQSASTAGSGAGGASPGAPNGSNASGQASLSVAWKGARGPSLAVPYGRSETVQGRLLAPGGVPIVGARIDVLATSTYAGARAAAASTPLTGADGRFALRVAPGASSRTLLFAYRSRIGDPQPATTRTLTLAVGAAVSLTIAPRTAGVGMRIYFSGRLLGGPVPAVGKLLVLEARSGGTGWIKFNVVRSDRSGRYRASYRFRFPGPARYRFRAVSEREGDYPYATGASNAVVVHER